MKILKETGRRALCVITMAVLLLSMPLGMDAKKRSNKRSRTTTTQTQRTIVIEDNWWSKIILYPSGYAKWEGPNDGNSGTWTLHTRTIGTGTKQVYYEINVGGKFPFYWINGSTKLYYGYSNFSRNIVDVEVKWYYL